MFSTVHIFKNYEANLSRKKRNHLFVFLLVFNSWNIYCGIVWTSPSRTLWCSVGRWDPEWHPAAGRQELHIKHIRHHPSRPHACIHNDRRDPPDTADPFVSDSTRWRCWAELFFPFMFFPHQLNDHLKTLTFKILWEIIDALVDLKFMTLF